MQLIRKLALGVATLSVAFGAGQLVQSGSAPQIGRVATADATPKAIVPLAYSAPRPSAARIRAQAEPPAALVPAPTAVAAAVPLPPALAETVPILVGLSSLDAVDVRPEPPATVLATVEADKLPDSLTTTAPSAPAPTTPPVAEACDPALSVTPGQDAMLQVALYAPCARHAAVVLRHGGLALSARIGAEGALRLALPALEDSGKVALTMADGRMLTAGTALPMMGLHRVAVQWLGDDSMQLQVYEDGAAFGQPGHLSALSRDGAGTLDRLGMPGADLPMMSEIYTFPPAPMPVEVMIEAAVTEATCGREILGQVLESRDGRVTATDLTLAMPGCDAVGDILVLNNLLADTTLAQAE